MNTMQLECFIQVAANLNFRRAADELHLSQPTVSKQVSSLEDEVGGALFTRSTRSVALTALGEAFLPDAEEILRLMYASAGKARRLPGRSVLVVGYSDSCELDRLSAAFRRIRRANPQIAVSLRQASRDVNVEQLARGRIDAVIGFESAALEVEGIGFTLIREDRLACVVRRGSPLASLPAAHAADVEGCPQIVCLPPDLQRQGYAAEGSIPPGGTAHTTRCETAAEALCLCDAGFGYVLLPSAQVTETRAHVCIPWRDSPVARYGIYHRANDRSEELSLFLQAAAAVFGRDGGARDA